MPHQRIQAARTLNEIAVAQQGYFTASQARSAGIADNAHPYHVRAGNWLREWRGIYRFTGFPETDDSYLVLWSLWSRNRHGTIQGVYSHESALALHDIGDVNPAKLHMTVPPGFRRSSLTPDVLVLHKSRIASHDRQQRMGYDVLKPIPAIMMLFEEGRISDDIIVQAVRDGISKGLFTIRQLQAANASEDFKGLLERIT